MNGIIGYLLLASSAHYMHQGDNYLYYFVLLESPIIVNGGSSKDQWFFVSGRTLFEQTLLRWMIKRLISNSWLLAIRRLLFRYSQPHSSYSRVALPCAVQRQTNWKLGPCKWTWVFSSAIFIGQQVVNFLFYNLRQSCFETIKLCVDAW